MSPYNVSGQLPDSNSDHSLNFNAMEGPVDERFVLLWPLQERRMGVLALHIFFFFLGAVTNHTGDHGVMLNQQAESPSLFACSGIIWYTRSGRSQASKSPDQRATQADLVTEL